MINSNFLLKKSLPICPNELMMDYLFTLKLPNKALVQFFLCLQSIIVSFQPYNFLFRTVIDCKQNLTGT